MQTAEEVEQLRSELVAAKRQVLDLQQQLAAARAEAAHLREQQQQQQQAAAARDAGGGADGGPGSLGKMQERLDRLRKEQGAAEAEREAAWAQVRAVVSDISALATVDTMASVSIPRGG